MRKSLFDSEIVEHKSRPPLRWAANFAGSIAGWAILKISYYDELENFGFKYKLHSLIWKMTWPFYYRFGTFYNFDFNMNGDGWDDYDSDGVPYWEKTGTIDPDTGHNLLDCLCEKCDVRVHCKGCMDCDNDFIDEETGDAFRVIGK